LAHRKKIKVGASTLVFELVDVRQQRRLLKVTLLGLGAVVLLLVALKLLLPPDRAAQQIELARHWPAQGDLEKSVAAYEAALRIDPRRAEARDEFTKAKAALDAKRMLHSAEKAAEEEKYDKAKDLVYRVLREFPKHTRALELESVVKAIENADLAYKGRNWSDAVTLLEKAREKYPKSALISSHLDEAQKELLSERSLARAREAMQHQQFEGAEGLLAMIPSNSVYYSEARERLDTIQREKKTAAWVQKAEASYRASQLPEALEAVEEGLKTAPTNSTLLDLRERARKIHEFQPGLTAAEALRESDGLEPLLDGRAVCDSVLKTEPDPLNEIRKRAQTTKASIEQWLRARSESFTTEGQKVQTAGNTKEAVRLFQLALRADPANQSAATAGNKLREQIQRECRKLFGEGLRFEELQEKALAQERFRKVVEIAPPDDEYYKKASAKLK
jgi:tetratricopeptide (TPR) repeat protein